MSPNARVSLLLAGLPLTAAFATFRDGLGTTVSTAGEGVLGVESSGTRGGFFPPLYSCPRTPCDPDDPLTIPLFPSDVCQSLDRTGETKSFEIVPDGTWCGAYDKDSCANSGGRIFGEDVDDPVTGKVLVKLAGSHMTSYGTAVAYDVCAWDPDWNNNKGKCRAASYSYFCHETCAGVVHGRARADPEVTLESETVKKLVPCKGGVEGSYGWCKVNFEEQVLIRNGRRLEVADPMKKPEKRRQLQSGECGDGDPLAKLEYLSDGTQCCTGSFPLTDTANIFSQVFTIREGAHMRTTVGTNNDEGEAMTAVFQRCAVENDDCVCNVGDGELVANDMCLFSSRVPVIWGANGVRGSPGRRQ